MGIDKLDNASSNSSNYDIFDRKESTEFFYDNKPAVFGTIADMASKSPDGIASANEVNNLAGRLTNLVDQAGGKLKISDIKDTNLRSAAFVADNNSADKMGTASDGYVDNREINNIQNQTLRNIVGSDQQNWQTDGQ